MLAVDGNSMPQITPGGSVDMTLHQVNGDGAGPYECMIDSTGAGTQWAPMTVTQNVPGTNSRSQAKAQDFVSVQSSSRSSTLPFKVILIWFTASLRQGRRRPNLHRLNGWHGRCLHGSLQQRCS